MTDIFVPRTADFTMVIGSDSNIGGCTGAGVGLTNLTMSGTVTGWCDHWAGDGTASDGVHTVAVSVVKNGTTMTVTAGPTVAATVTPWGTTISVRALQGSGKFNLVPVPVVSGSTVTNSCMNGTARNFHAHGSMWFA